MPAGISGSLLTTAFIERHLTTRAATGHTEPASQSIARWWNDASARCGPASSIRTLIDLVAGPLASMLGFSLQRPVRLSDDIWTATFAHDLTRVPAVITTWGAPPEHAWPQGRRLGLATGADWWLLLNGPTVRLVDARRHTATRHLDINLQCAADDDSTAALLHRLLSSAALADGDPTGGLASLVSVSDRDAHAVCAALRSGVREALEHLLNGLIPPGRRGDPVLVGGAYDEAQTAIYRLLFLLFAEARALVPTWHPIYRNAYTIERLRELADRGTRPEAIWPAFQAIWRLAHQGCEAGDLKVTAFNGRLFSPHRAPRLASATISASSVRQATLALSTASVRTRSSRERIAYGDLGVEELGGIYEALLEFEPVLRHESAPQARHTAVLRLERSATDRRKQTGTFYTPHQLTRYLVSRTLEPLVRHATPEGILALRILDPAMGSGAFLVAACRFLALAYEQALAAAGHCLPADIDEHERAGFRRLVAQRCLYGVDANPAAVQLARLSLWLTTLAADRPLGFLDHHIMAGNSLVGVRSWSDLLVHHVGRARAPGPTSQLTLFSLDEWEDSVRTWLPIRRDLAERDDRAPRDVRWKETQLASLTARTDRQRSRRLCDLWCSQWTEGPNRRAEFAALAEHIANGCSALPDAAASTALAQVASAAARHGFFHWPLEFPEVFCDDSESRSADRGFDAVIGNPPWEMLRADEGRPHEEGMRAAVRFSRHSRQYSAQSSGHANAYQLFVERAVSLTRAGGRFGLVVPHGLASDHGAAPLRRLLLQTCDTDTLVGIENRAGVFPIHRGVRFLLATGTKGSCSTGIRCRFGVRDPNRLEHLDEERPDEAFPITITPALLERLSGPGLQIPDLRSPTDLQIAEGAVARHPPLGSPEGWGVTFGRELNATDDRASFTTSGAGLVIVEGKHLSPFAVAVERATMRIAASEAARLLGSRSTCGRPRLAFRDVTSATNRLTLIAAIVPPQAVTTHTVFCLRTELAMNDQWLLCALLNSFIANFLVRQRVSSHVTLAMMARLPVPRPPRGSLLARRLSARARWLSTDRPAEAAVHAELQALAALAYGISREALAHVLSTFPLVPLIEREAVMRAFERITREGMGY